MKTVENFQIEKSGKGLEELRTQLERIATSWNLSDQQLFELNLIIEEIYVNSIEHVANRQMYPVQIKLCRDKDKLVITIADQGPKFAPTKTTDPDIHLSIDKRKAGGLGLFLVRHYADSISYTRTDNTNILHIEKKLN
jgi:anti-sigma regulatory factor (Ser/Thr protein kinase)